MIQSGIATIYVTDLERAVRFYTGTLGLELVRRAGDEWAQVAAPGGFQIGLHPARTGSRPAGVRGSISVGLSVDGPLDDLVRTLEGRGVEFRGPVKENGPVRIADLGDPDGNDLYLYSYAE